MKKLLKLVPIVKTIEVHNGLTGLIVEKNIIAERESIDQFEAMCISSLYDSIVKGKPDIELVLWRMRLNGYMFSEKPG